MIKARKEKIQRFKKTRDSLCNFMGIMQKMLDEENERLCIVFSEYALRCTFRNLSDKKHRQAPLLICTLVGLNSPCDVDNCPEFVKKENGHGRDNQT